MKKILVIFGLVLNNFMYSQNVTVSELRSKEEILNWEVGNKAIYKVTNDEISTYYFVFKNSKYPNLNKFESIKIGSFEEFKNLTFQLDSLLNNVVLTKGQSKTYTIGEVKNITLENGIFLIYDNEMLGYTGLYKKDLKKLKALFESK